MRIEVTEEVPRWQRNCCAGCLVYAGLCALGALSMGLFGDRAPSYTITIESRFPHPLAVGFSEGNGVVEGEVERLPMGVTEFYPAFPRDGENRQRVSVYRKESDTSLLCACDVSNDLKSLNEGKSRLVVEPATAGCRIEILRSKD